NSHFEIERSDNGTDFGVIGRMDGAGTTSSTRTYTFTDQTFRSELSYYRLRQIDLDGSADYSGIITVKNSPQLAGRLYPNPVDDVLFSNLPANALDYTISDANGKIVQSGQWKNTEGISTAEL